MKFKPEKCLIVCTYQCVSVCCVQRSSVRCIQPVMVHPVHTHTSSRSRDCFAGPTERHVHPFPPNAGPSMSSPWLLDPWYPAWTTGPPKPVSGCMDKWTGPLPTERGQAPSWTTSDTSHQDPRQSLLTLSSHTPADQTCPWYLSFDGVCICPQARRGYLGARWALCAVIFHLYIQW